MLEKVDTVVGVDSDPLQLDDIPDAASLMHVTAERLYRLLKRQMNEVLRASNSSLIEWRILLMLRIHKELCQRDLVDEVAMLQAHVSRTLGEMQDRGLVSVRKSGDDRRVRMFSLTPAGRALYQRLAPTMALRKQMLDAALTPSEKEHFLAAATKIARVAELQLLNQDTPLRTGSTFDAYEV